MELLRIVSDLHIEDIPQHFNDEQILSVSNFYIEPNEKDLAAILIIAGDLSSNNFTLGLFLTAVCARFKHVLFVPGNHEGYTNCIQDVGTFLKLHQKKIKNLSLTTLTDVRTVELYGIKFVLGTLWGDGGISDYDRIIVQQTMNDFRYIRYNDGQHVRKYSIYDMIENNKKQKQKIKRALKTKFVGRTVVITHHLPSRKLVSERFLCKNGTDGSNGGFCAGADSILEEHAPDLWVHGHTHDRVSTKLFNTRIECNPRGYKSEHKDESILNTYRNTPVFIDMDTLEILP